MLFYHSRERNLKKILLASLGYPFKNWPLPKNVSPRRLPQKPVGPKNPLAPKKRWKDRFFKNALKKRF
jgi:hypothetical protein